MFDDCKEQPTVLRKPEIIHGLRNLLQNAVDFASDAVSVEASWSPDEITVRIMDDGPGFPSHLFGQIGEPFMRNRSRTGARNARPEYDGMGLGLFIAKTLLERSGAKLRFANGTEGKAHPGAVVEVVWPRHLVDAHSTGNPEIGSENVRITA